MGFSEKGYGLFATNLKISDYLCCILELRIIRLVISIIVFLGIFLLQYRDTDFFQNLPRIMNYSDPPPPLPPNKT